MAVCPLATVAVVGPSGASVKSPPVPLSARLCGELGAFEAMLSIPLRAPATSGWNATRIVQALPTASEAVQVFDPGTMAKSPVIASELHMEVDDLFPVAEALQLLRFAEIEGGDIRLTDPGKQFAEGGVDDRKKLFQRQLLDHVPLAAHIRRVLQERANHTAPRSRFRDELEDHMTADSARQTLQSVVAWARFSEAFAYDARSETFSLENPT